MAAETAPATQKIHLDWTNFKQDWTPCYQNNIWIGYGNRTWAVTRAKNDYVQYLHRNMCHWKESASGCFQPNERGQRIVKLPDEDRLNDPLIATDQHFQEDKIQAFMKTLTLVDQLDSKSPAFPEPTHEWTAP